jgi:TusA-related sulfurtransferase
LSSKKNDVSVFHDKQRDEEGASFAINDHLDVRGMNCSKAASFALTASLKLPAGGVLEVVGNKMCAKMEVPGAVTSKAFLSVFHIVEQSEAEDSLWWIYIRRA